MIRKLSALVGTLLVLSSLSARAADESGAFAGVAVGRSDFSLSNLSVPLKDKDGRDTTFKLYGGYRFDERFSLEAGYARLGTLGATAGLAGGDVRQEGRGQSLYAVGAARLFMNGPFALSGRLGIARNKVSGSNLLSAADSLQGSRTSAVWGLGAEYKLSDKLSLTADYDNYGKLSDRVKASSFTVGLRSSF